MAEYEDYLAVSETYDTWRVPVGVDSLERALDTAAKGVDLPRSSLKLLDVGCGTGNYIGILKEKVGSCTGLEFNKGMLAAAQAKHKGDNRVTLTAGSAVDMDCFEDETFDVIIITQVLHHLSMDMQDKALANMQRVLKKGGVVWMSSFIPGQADGYWFNFLIPQAASLIGTRCPGLPLLKRQLARAGLTISAFEIVKESTMNADRYYDINGPFDEKFRQADSTWALATQDEIEAGLAWWKEQIDAGLVEEIMKKREERREEIGQTTAVTCVKLKQKD